MKLSKKLVRTVLIKLDLDVCQALYEKTIRVKSMER